MKFWVYGIDWRAMSIEVIAECDTEHEAELQRDQHVKSLTPPQLQEMTDFQTIGITPVSQEMLVAVEQFKRVQGRLPAAK